MRVRNPFRRPAPIASGSLPGFRAATDAHYWHERFGPDARWADFSSSDPTFEWAVNHVAHLQGTRFRQFQLSHEDAKVHCTEIRNDPVGDLPFVRFSWWPSLEAALAHAGGHSRTEADGLPVQVFVGGEERFA